MPGVFPVRVTFAFTPKSIFSLLMFTPAPWAMVMVFVWLSRLFTRLMSSGTSVVGHVHAGSFHLWFWKAGPGSQMKMREITIYVLIGGFCTGPQVVMLLTILFLCGAYVQVGCKKRNVRALNVLSRCWNCGWNSCFQVWVANLLIRTYLLHPARSATGQQ